MTRNENQMYSDITSIRKSLEKIANALDNNVTQTTKDIPGFEGVLNDLDNLYQPDLSVYGKKDEDDDSIHNDYLNEIVTNMNQIEYSNFHRDLSLSFAQNDAVSMTNFIYELEYEECLGAIKTALFITGDSDYINNVECSEYDKSRKDTLTREYIVDRIDGFDNLRQDPCTYETDLQGMRVDSDHDIRSTAKFYEDEYLEKEGATKKECILDYVTNEFGSHGARYTDIIKFAYYLGAHNAPKYTSENRGYYSLAFSKGQGGYLIQGGKNQLVKGINKEGNERYFALSEVESFTDYYKRIQ